MTYNNDYENNNNFKPEDELNQEEQKSYSNPPMICATYEQTEKKERNPF